MEYTRELLRRLRKIEKHVQDEWIADFEDLASGTRRRHICEVTVDGVRFSFEVLGRQGKYADDYSGILLVQSDGTAQQRLVRVNGPHDAVHANQLQPRARIPPETCHVHYMTVRYYERSLERSTVEPDGFAIATTACWGLPAALEVLSKRTAIMVAAPTLQTGTRTQRKLP